MRFSGQDVGTTCHLCQPSSPDATVSSMRGAEQWMGCATAVDNVPDTAIDVTVDTIRPVVQFVGRE